MNSDSPDILKTIKTRFQGFGSNKKTVYIVPANKVLKTPRFVFYNIDYAAVSDFLLPIENLPENGVARTAMRNHYNAFFVNYGITVTELR